MRAAANRYKVHESAQKPKAQTSNQNQEKNTITTGIAMPAIKAATTQSTTSQASKPIVVVTTTNPETTPSTSTENPLNLTIETSFDELETNIIIFPEMRNAKLISNHCIPTSSAPSKPGRLPKSSAPSKPGRLPKSRSLDDLSLLATSKKPPEKLDHLDLVRASPVSLIEKTEEPDFEPIVEQEKSCLAKICSSIGSALSAIADFFKTIFNWICCIKTSNSDVQE